MIKITYSFDCTDLLYYIYFPTPSCRFLWGWIRTESTFSKKCICQDLY